MRILLILTLCLIMINIDLCFFYAIVYEELIAIISQAIVSGWGCGCGWGYGWGYGCGWGWKGFGRILGTQSFCHLRLFLTAFLLTKYLIIGELTTWAVIYPYSVFF